VEIISVIGARRVYEVSTEGTIDVTVYPAEFTLLNNTTMGSCFLKLIKKQSKLSIHRSL
jgi:hypothetical protein